MNGGDFVVDSCSNVEAGLFWMKLKSLFSWCGNDSSLCLFSHGSNEQRILVTRLFIYMVVYGRCNPALRWKSTRKVTLRCTNLWHDFYLELCNILNIVSLLVFSLKCQPHQKTVIFVAWPAVPSASGHNLMDIKPIRERKLCIKSDTFSINYWFDRISAEWPGIFGCTFDIKVEGNSIQSNEKHKTLK